MRKQVERVSGLLIIKLARRHEAVGPIGLNQIIDYFFADFIILLSHSKVP